MERRGARYFIRMLEFFCEKHDLVLPNNRLTELIDISNEIVRSFGDDRSDPEDAIESALELLVCWSSALATQRKKLRQRLVDFQDAVLINDFDEFVDNFNVPATVTVDAFEEPEPSVDFDSRPTDDEVAQDFHQALNKDIFDKEELQEKILVEAKAGPWTEVTRRKDKPAKRAPIRITPDEQLANLFPEHSKAVIDMALIECGTVDEAAIYLMSVQPNKAQKKKHSFSRSLEKLETQLSRSPFVERELRSHIP